MNLFLILFTESLGVRSAVRIEEFLAARISRIVRLGVYIAAVGDRSDLVKIADAASNLFRDIFGEDRMSARLVFGVESLPLGLPVELEVILEVT